MESASDVTKRPPAWTAGLISRPAYAVLLFAAVQCVVWTLAPALTHTAPPLDVVESYLWGREWVVGTFKHPNMPGWVLELSRQLTGAVGWPAYLASQLFVGATYLAVFLLGREMMDGRRALAGTLLLAGVFYFAWPSIEFNHNVAQMPFWALIAWVVWRLRTRGTIFWWAVLGCLGADSLFAKLSSGLLLLVAGLWILGDPALRKQLARPAPWIGLLVFVVLSLPLWVWLSKGHFRPLLYAAERSSGSVEGPLRFLGAQVLACLGLVALAALAGLFGRRTGATETSPAAPIAIAFLAVMTFAPIAIATLIAVAVGSGLKPMWGSPMLGLAGLLTIALTSARVTDVSLARLMRAVGVLLVVLPLGYALDTLFESQFNGKPKRQNWPQAQIARRFDEIWQGATGKPLKIVAGERWIAGLTALRPGEMPSILTDGNLELSPWITPQRLRSEGALVVWEMTTPADAPPAGLAGLLAGHAASTEQFAWSRFPNAKPLLIGYAIVPPA